MDKNTDKSTESDGRARSLANLKPAWQPGKSGNPKGKPKGVKHGVRYYLNKILERQIPGDLAKQLEEKGVCLDSMTEAEYSAYALIKRGQEGDTAASKLVLENTEPPLPKDINLNGNFNVTIPSKDANTL